MRKITQIALLVGATFGVCSANAGSYQLNDYSVTGLGRSYAGQGIMGDDYSAIAMYLSIACASVEVGYCSLMVLKALSALAFSPSWR